MDSPGEGAEATGANKVAGGVITPITVPKDQGGVSDASHLRTRGITILPMMVGISKGGILPTLQPKQGRIQGMEASSLPAAGTLGTSPGTTADR